VHYVSQEVKLTEAARMQTPGDFVIAADVERRELLAELAQLEAKASTPPPPSSSFADEAAAVSSNGGGAADADTGLNDQEQLRYAAVSEQLELINADSAERRAADLLKALGFTDELRQRPLKELSGGWRVRTALAAAIFAKPDLLLLDEPTNHLSIAAVLWLARELSQGDTWKDRTIVIVSHDRFFVDEVTKKRNPGSSSSACAIMKSSKTANSSRLSILLLLFFNPRS
jgi:ATP-binding cassette subfamily F protein 3